MAMVPCLHQGNIYTKRNLRVWRDQKCIPLIGAITPLNCAGRQNTPSRGRQYRAQNGKLRKLRRTYLHGTVFAPRKYLYQKEATGIERPEMWQSRIEIEYYSALYVLRRWRLKFMYDYPVRVTYTCTLSRSSACSLLTLDTSAPSYSALQTHNRAKTALMSC